MNGLPDPVIVTVDPAAPEPHRAALADVLIAQRSSTGRWVDVFERYPGLSLAAVVDRDGLYVAVRDGPLLVLRTPPSPDLTRLIVTVLYLAWATGSSFPAFHGVSGSSASYPVAGSGTSGRSAMRPRTWAAREEPRESKMSSA